MNPMIDECSKRHPIAIFGEREKMRFMEQVAKNTYLVWIELMIKREEYWKYWARLERERH